MNIMVKKDYNKKIGGKLSKPKSLKQIGKEINKGFDITTRGLSNAGNEIGKFTNKQLLPAVVSAGIPIASSALGLVGQEFGIPSELTSSLSSNLMKEYIPSQYQSKNKYVGMFGDALNMALSGETNPNEIIPLFTDFTNQLGKDIGIPKKSNDKQNFDYHYNSDNPYQDIINQMIKNQSNYTEINDDKYQQKEGSIDALLGAGIKKRRGRPKKEIFNDEIYIKKKPSYKKFSHAVNTSLDQLLEAKADREENEAKKAMKTLIDKQTKALTALGYGIKGKGAEMSMRVMPDVSLDDKASFEELKKKVYIPSVSNKEAKNIERRMRNSTITKKI